MYTAEIREGDLVRAYAAPGLYGDYVEGVVLAIGPVQYSVLVEREVRAGREVPLPVDGWGAVYPSIDGDPDGAPSVVKIADRETLGGQESSLDC